MKMNDIDLEKYKSAWKEEKSFNKETLTDSEIKNYLLKRSKGLTDSFKAGLILDNILKIILGASFVVLIFLFPGKFDILVLCVIAILLLFYLLWLNITTYRKIPRQEEYSGDMQNFLKSRIEFYRTKYLKTVYVIALSNPFVFLGGMLYYFYFKYGMIRPLQVEDIIVFSIFCIAGFALGAFIQVRQFNYQVNQLEECLKELQENGIDELAIRRHKKQKRTIMIIFMIALLTGLLLLGVLFTL